VTLSFFLVTTFQYSEPYDYGSDPQEIEKDVDTIWRHIVDAFTGGEPTLFPAPPVKAS
jgi:hypothetical protein